VIAKGEKKSVTFSLMRRDLSYWNVVAQQWALAKGEYGLSVGSGSTSRDFRSTGSLVVG
jgi:beta-glucosidase